MASDHGRGAGQRTRVTVRIDSDLLTTIDRLVECGAFETRSAALRTFIYGGVSEFTDPASEDRLATLHVGTETYHVSREQVHQLAFAVCASDRPIALPAILQIITEDSHEH